MDNTPSTPAHLETTVYQLLTVIEALEQHNATLAAQVAALAETVQNQQQVGEVLRQQLAHSVQAAARQVSQQLGEEARKALFTAVNAINYPLHHAAEKTQQALENARAQVEDNHWKSLLLTVGSAVLAGLLSVWLIMPKPTLPLTDDQMKTYAIGQDFLQRLRPLSAPQRQGIWRTLYGKKSLLHKRLLQKENLLE